MFCFALKINNNKMNTYIRDFNVEGIETFKLDNVKECNTVLNINNHTENLKILHSNIRSIAKNLDEFKIYIQQFDFNFDCIVFSETWRVYDTTIYNMQGYDLIYNEGDYNQNDGVIIYLKSDISHSYEIISLGTIKALKLKIKYNSKSITLTAVYRSPSSCPHEYNINFKNYLEAQINFNDDYHIIVGDINIDISQKQIEFVSEYLDNLREYGFISTINSYTRVQGNSKSCIDHMFIKSKCTINENLLPIILQSDITDHYTEILQIVFQLTIYDKNINKTENRKYRTVMDFNKVKRILQNTAWEHIYSTDLEKETNNFVKLISEAVKESTTYIKIKHNKIKRKHWITNALVISINKKNEMYNKLLRDKNNVDLKLEYKNYKNMLRSLIKKTKNDYYKQKIDKAGNDSGRLWRTVTDITQNYKSKISNITIMNKEGTIIEEKEVVASCFNKTFAEVGKTLASKIKRNVNYQENRRILQNSFFLMPTDASEVKLVIEQLKNKKSTGNDGIQAEVIKFVADTIIVPLVRIINKIFETGYFPSALKTSIVIPIFKNGDRQDILNYRPISLITNFAKIVEKILKSRVAKYIEKYNLLSKMQFGFQQGKSTQDAIINLTERIYSALDEGKPSLCVFVDLAKAFDTVSHELLLNTLEDMGFRNNALKLFKSYLTGRKQCVKINDVQSSYINIEHGVPQGTVLGPILFTVYINGLYSAGSTSDIVSFADDTAFFYKGNTWNELKTIVETDMNIIMDWFNHMLLTINIKKTQYIPFCPNSSGSPQFTDLDIQLAGETQVLKSATEVKYLGIMIDRHLRWDVHANYIRKKLSCILYRFKHLKNFLGQRHLKILYHSLVESHLSYGILGWGGLLNSHIAKLDIMQKKFLKIILDRKPTHPTEELFKEAKVLDLRQLFFLKANLCLNMNKDKLQIPNHSYNTRRHKIKYITPRAHKTIGQRSYSYLGPRLYNSLPLIIRSERSHRAFKRELKKYILNTPRLEIHEIINIKNS